jgi:DNA-binding CsgD family transcriptional regulator
MLPLIIRNVPLVGRREEVEFIDKLRCSGQSGGAVLGGGQGVGKTRLAEEVLSQARQDGWLAERVTGTAAANAIRLAAFGHLLPRAAIGTDDPLALLLATVDQLAARATAQPLLIHVDDAHELDPASIELVRRLAQVPRIFPLLTVRSDEPIPASLVALWKDGPACRIELPTLGRDETEQLVRAWLGAPVEPATLAELWNASVGNPLFLRELVLAYAEQSALRQVGGAWRRNGTVGSSPRLVELVRTRIARLTGDQRTVLDTLAVSGALDLDLLGAVVARPALASVVERGLIRVTEVAGAPVVDLVHPLYGAVLRGQVSLPGRRTIRHRLLDAVAVRCGTAGVVADPADLIRSTLWRLEQGERVDVDQLLAAAHAALTGYSYALAAWLGANGATGTTATGTGTGTGTTATGTAATAATATGTAATGSPNGRSGAAAGAGAVGPQSGSQVPDRDGLLVAERLARAAWRAQRSLPTGLALATVLTALGRAAEAESILAIVDRTAQTASERARMAFARASLLCRSSGREAEAVAVLTAAEADLADGELRDALARLRAGIALDAGEVGPALALASRLLAQRDGRGPVAATVAATLTAALAVGGRAEEAIATAERHLDLALAQLDRAPAAAGELMVGRILAERWLGRLDRAEALASACYQPAAEAGSLDAMAVFGAVLGQTLLDQGRPRTAAGWFRESAAMLRERDMFGYRPWVLALLAMATAQTGEAAAADQAAREAEASAAPARYFASELLVGRAWAQAAAGDGRAALASLRRAAEPALRSGLLVFAAGALHTAVRLGEPRRVAAELANLASASPLAEAYARHATALATQDGPALEEVASTFERLGARLLAAEAAAHATAAYHRRGTPGAALRAAARSRQLARDCEGARTPALRLAVRVPVLTAREQEIATLIGEGTTSRLVADRLTLSVRTVENHLYHIYRKLGVCNRAGLATLLAAAAPPGS